MIQNYSFYLLFFFILFIACKSSVNYTVISPQINNSVKKNSKIDLRNWHFKDIINDTIPGISLERVYDELLRNKSGKEVVVAVIDMEVDIDHKFLKERIWTNVKEIANNNIDDDQNGYIDDIHGWNFLGNSSGNNNRFVNYEYTRILKKLNPKFQNIKVTDINSKDSLSYIIYKKALEAYDNRVIFAKKDVKYANMISNSVYETKKALSDYFIDSTYSIKDLDSLKQIYPENKELHKYIKKQSGFIKYGFTEDYVNNYKLKAEERIDKLLNLEYNDRIIQGDNPNDILDINYGNNNMNGHVNFFDHGTKMAGIIANISLKDEIKIMPLSISAFGDEHDKDIVLAIKYAVDNGANVINMSFAKEFSLYPKWIEEAIIYADKNNVLIVNSASNDGIDLDKGLTYSFPNDHSYFEDSEVSNNYIKVGSSGVILNNKFKLRYSNYGKKEVDIFAPGKNIYTTLPNNSYTNTAGGTSSASAITSGVAALIYSYYPNLTAYQVKKIIMDSGLEYNIDVSIPSEEYKAKTIPFNQLSKSGKVINAYNAFLLADKY